MAVSDFIIVNPVSASGRADEYAARLESALFSRGISSEIEFTLGSNSAYRLAKRASEEYERVWALGGDGTLSMISAGLIGSNAKLAVLPLGTGNDFVKTAGIPVDFNSAVECALKDNVVLADIVRCNDEYFFNVGGLGFDADVAAGVTEFSSRGHTGMKAYLMSLFKALFSLRFVEMSVEAEECSLRAEATLVDVGNGQFIGGGIRVCPNADITDGWLDVCFIKKVPRLLIPGMLFKVIKGTHLSSDKVVYFRTKRLKIEADEEVNIQLDGQISRGKVLDIEVIPAAIRLLV